jgi:hypothetical protein
MSGSKDKAVAVQWVARVLGVTLNDVGEERTIPPLLPIWTAAAEQATDELVQLQTAIRALRTPLAAMVARKGIGGLIIRIRSDISASLEAFDHAPADQRAQMAKDVRHHISDMRMFIGANAALPMLEKNSFGVAVSVRPKLDNALDKIEAILSS